MRVLRAGPSALPRYVLPLLVVALAGSAMTVKPAVPEAQAYIGPHPIRELVHWPEVWEWIVEGEPELDPNSRDFWNRVRNRLGRIPPRWVANMTLGTAGAVGGYAAWKICDAVVLDNCDFLGLRDMVGNWGNPSVRLTTVTGTYTWTYVTTLTQTTEYRRGLGPGTPEWQLRASGPNVSGGGYVSGNNHAYRQVFDGSVWITSTNTSVCTTDTSTRCNQANTEIEDVFDTAVRGSQVIVNQYVGAPAVGSVRHVYRVMTDAEFQSHLGRDGQWFPDVPDPFDWPNQQPGTAELDPTQPPAESSPGTPSPERGEVLDEFDVPASSGGLTSPQKDAIGTGLDPLYEGEGFTLPDCAGMTLVECVAALEAAGHEGDVVEHELAPDVAILTDPPGLVTSTAPEAGEVVTISTPITVYTNPDPLPFELPPPVLHETYTEYVERLQGLGWVGTATVRELTEATGTPELGPDAPVTVKVPQIGSTPARTMRVVAPWPDPPPRVELDAPIEFTKNPADYAPPEGSPGDPIAPPDGGIDFGPLVPTEACTKFPFGVVCWFREQIEVLFLQEPRAPHVSVTTPALTTALGTIPPMTYGWDFADTTVFDGYIALIRAALGFLLWLAGLWYLGSRMLGVKGGPDTSDGIDL